MTVTETLGSLGSWEVRLVEGTPDAVLTQLGFFGHIAIVAGPVDVEAAGDGLLAGARYVGVTRAKGKGGQRRLAGSGMVFWLGDEDNKGHVLESEVSLTAATINQAVAALLPPTVTLGTLHPGAAGTYTGKHVFQSPRQALTAVCDAFGRELRVNGNATVDIGTQAQLYTATPDSILVRKGAGSDLDLTALTGDLDVDANVYDYSTDVVLLGQTIGVGEEPTEVFATGRASAPVVPHVDLRGNPVKLTRLISESGETQGSVAARSQLQLNRFNRTARSLNIQLDDYETEGTFRVGDNTYVYDPETDIFDPAREVDFRGELLHPDIVRVSGMTWPVARGMTVAFRTQAGLWLDLTPFVIYETGTTELTIGDLPKSLSRPGDDPLQVRIDAARGDASIPKAPTNLQLTTDSTLSPQGQTIATIGASWNAVTQNTDNSVITDLSHYLVEYRPQFRAPLWQGSRVTATTSVDLTALVPDLDYDVRVAAVDMAGHTSGWSSVVGIKSAKDATAPPAPADPVASQVLGQTRIEYIGTTSTGGQMPSDTNRVEFHIGTTAGFTATAATRVNSVNPFAKGVHYETVPYGAAARWAKLVAVDHTGNVSGASASVPLTASQVVSPDIFDGAIGSAKLADLAVTNAKIGLLAVNDANIGNLNVGKLTAGTLAADVVMGGRFTTALTGSRREVNGIGFQAFDAAENLMINLDGVDNLLTGRYQTALTGRRILMGAAGASGSIQFFSPDGLVTPRLISYTSSTVSPGEEVISLGIPIAGTYGAWNAVQVEAQEQIFLTSSLTAITIGGNGPPTQSKAFVIRYANTRGSSPSTPPTFSTRFQIDNRNLISRDTLGRMMYHITTESAVYLHRWYTYSNDSPTGTYDGFMELESGNRQEVSSLLNLKTRVQPNGSVYGGLFRFWLNADYTNARMEVWDQTVTMLIPVWASAFTVGSDEVRKNNIRDLDVDALAKVRAMRGRRWDEKPTKGRDEDGNPGADTTPRLGRIGLVAQEAPAEIVVDGGGEAGKGIDLYGQTTLNSVAIGQLATVVDDIGDRLLRLEGMVA